MTTTTLALNAYQQSSMSTGTPRGLEYQMFSRLTGALTSTEKNKQSNYPAYISALSRNLEFWTLLGADVAYENNGLPAPLRAQLFRLFEFTRVHTEKIIRGGASLTTDALVEINNNVMAGLRGVTGGQSE